MSRFKLVIYGVVALIAVLFAVGGAFVARGTRKTKASPPPSASPKTPANQPSPPSQASAVPTDAKTLPAALPPDHTWLIPPPTAEWMTVAASPILADVVLDERRQTEKEVTAGGGMIHVGGQGAQFTLSIPPGALLMNEKIRLTVVRSVGGLPFAGGIASAVEISPLNGPFLKPVSLTIEPRRRNATAPPPAVAGFAIDGSHEWHLVPTILSSTPVNRFFQDRQQIVITGAGTYGVAEATEEEVRSAAQRRPSNLMARIETELALLMRGNEIAHAAAAWPASLFAVLHAQSDDPDRRELITRLVQRLREIYDQQLMPKLQGFKPGCEAVSVLESRELHKDVLSWVRAVQLLGLTTGEELPQPDPEVERLRETMPLTYSIIERERAQNDAYYGPIIKEFDKRQAGLWDAFWNSLRHMYAALVQCCKTKPRYWMPRELLAFQKLGEMAGQADIFGGGGLQDAQDCACAVSAVFNQQGWEGSISHKYSASGDTNQSRGGRTSTSYSKVDYVSSIVLMGVDEKNNIVGFASAHGDEERSSKDEISGGSCQVHQRGSTTTSSGVSVTTTRVTISLYAGGYTISYTPPPAFGISRSNSWYKTAGCDNPFANHESNDWSISSAGITGGVSSTVQGKTENQLMLQGSKDYSLPPDSTLQRQQVSIKWDLRACQAQ